MKKERVLSWAVFPFFILFLLSTCTFSWALPVKKVPDTLRPSFDYLNGLFAEGCRADFDMGKVAPLVEFVKGEHSEKTLWSGDKRPEGTMAYYDFTVNASLEKMLKYCFNREIPVCAVIPDVVRLSTVSPAKGCEEHWDTLLWEKLESLGKPVIIDNQFYMQNTPDINSGAYYGYDSSQLEILFRDGESRIFLSVSRQNGVSDVGRKGYRLGEGDSKEFFYSGEKGLTRLGLGWVKSYIYDSYSVSLYIQEGRGTERVKCATFKWLNAGWNGNNMVKPSHIRKGLEDYAVALKNYIESDALPDYREIARACSELSSLPEEKMRALLRTWYKNVQIRNSVGDSNKLVRRFSGNNDYIEGMTEKELGSNLIRAYMKGLLNGNQVITLASAGKG